MMYLGKMFLYGQGFPVDYDMALLWFEKAAEEVIRSAPSFFCHACLHYCTSQTYMNIQLHITVVAQGHSRP